MKKILIIGGTGTISAPVTAGLAADVNNEVYVLNRGRHADTLPQNVHRIIGDIKGDPGGVKEALTGMEFDSVINFIIFTPQEAQLNIDLFADRTKQYIFISTVCVLDHSLSCNVDETMAYGNPYSAYGQNKEACEKLFLEAKEKDGFPVTVVRPTQTYSDSRYPLSIKGKTYWSVASRMLRGKEVIVHGDGQNTWACTHANDFAKLFNPLVCNPDTIGEIYQVMNPQVYTWDMIYEALAEALGAEYKPVYISEYLLDQSRTYDFLSSMHGDKHFSVIFDISKAKRFAPDIQFDIDIRKGAEMYVEYMNAHPEEKKEDEAFDAWCDDTIDRYKKMSAEFVRGL